MSRFKYISLIALAVGSMFLSSVGLGMTATVWIDKGAIPPDKAVHFAVVAYGCTTGTRGETVRVGEDIIFGTKVKANGIEFQIPYNNPEFHMGFPGTGYYIKDTTNNIYSTATNNGLQLKDKINYSSFTSKVPTNVIDECTATIQ